MELNKENLKRGTILVEQFGYSMILYNFYKVIRVNGAAVDLIKLPAKNVKTYGWLQWQVKPTDKSAWLQSDVIRKRFSKYGLKGTSDNYMSLYDDEAEYIEDHAD